MKVHFLFILFPYIAAALLCAGLVIRYGWLRNRISSITPSLSEVLSLFNNRLWQISLVLLLLGHLAGLLFPRQILLWDSSPWRLYTLEGFAFVVGLYVLYGWLRLLWK